VKPEPEPEPEHTPEHVLKHATKGPRKRAKGAPSVNALETTDKKRKEHDMPDETIPETAPHSEATDKLNEGKSHATQAVNDLRAAAEAKAAEIRAQAEGKVKELRGQAEHVYTDARHRVESLRGESETWVRENPTRAVMTALGVGFILGLMFRK
jgi:ElaB/YqjD/DUF883 family membrane-anchored ribosome-binding protein